MSDLLHIKYRPSSFDEVVGHKAILKSIQTVLAKKSSRAFLFHGPSGTGKTTLARIVAAEVGCLPEYVLEVDAATNNGVDNIRDIQETLRYLPMGKSSVRAIILDEAHMLSKAAWNSLLKVMENPPAHVYWFLCTTEIDKVITTVKSRCTTFGLGRVSDDLLKKLVIGIAKEEKIKVSEDVLAVVVSEAYGSPRQAIVNLNLCRACDSKKEAAELLKSAISSDATIALCKFLTGRGGSWAEAMKIVGSLKDENPEGVRIVVCNYVAKILTSPGFDKEKPKYMSDKDAAKMLAILEAFEGTFNQSEKLAPLVLAIGRVLLQ